jgi:hypothetical protein
LGKEDVIMGLIEEAYEIYEKHGQDAVIAWGIKKNLPFHYCEPCEIESPFIGNSCAVCGTYRRL